MRSFAIAACTCFCFAACDSGEAPAASDPVTAAAGVEKKGEPDSEKPVAVVQDPAKAPADKLAAGSVLIDHTVKNIDGEDVSLADYRGKALLIVNTASECGFTPQYTQLQKLHEAYADKGLVVLGFPSNDFGGQEPGSHEEIKSFVAKEYGVQFPMFSKVATKGDGQAQLYATLTTETAEHLQGDVKWNFTKFLVSPEGEVVARFESPVDPMADELREAVEAVLPPAG